MARHEISLTLASATSSTAPITAELSITDSRGEVLHSYELDEHEFVRLLRGGVVRSHDEMSNLRGGA